MLAKMMSVNIAPVTQQGAFRLNSNTLTIPHFGMAVYRLDDIKDPPTSIRKWLNQFVKIRQARRIISKIDKDAQGTGKIKLLKATKPPLVFTGTDIQTGYQGFRDLENRCRVLTQKLASFYRSANSAGLSMHSWLSPNIIESKDKAPHVYALRNVDCTMRLHLEKLFNNAIPFTCCREIY